MSDFEKLVDAGVFNAPKMNDAVWKFREFEAPSLTCAVLREEERVVGGWNVQRDTRLAKLMEAGQIDAGTPLHPLSDIDFDGVVAISSDAGIMIGGVRYTTPDEAAAAVSDDPGVDGWDYWCVDKNGELVPLSELEGAGSAVG